jgi:broad specificity phosphatase PhoE
LLLVRHAATGATRDFAFPADEPLDERGRDEAAQLSVPRGHGVISSPALRCMQTAQAAGLTVDRVEPALAESDFGTWAGLTLPDVADEDLTAWTTDPDATPHGGESLRAFARRVGEWLDGEVLAEGADTAITHGGVIKAAVVHALGAPLEAFWRVDVAPLSKSELHAHDGRWTVTRVNA